MLAGQLENERSRKRGGIVRDLHIVSNMLEEGGRFYSQSGQDRLIDSLLGGKTDGMFVDVGGYDGVTGSNTLFFETFRGWNGLLVEPSPTQLARAEAIRRCLCLGYAVAGKSGSADFMEVTRGYTLMSGFLDSYEPDLLTRVRANENHQETVHKLEKKPLADILKEQRITEIDYLSLDVEGGETEILQSFPFEDFDIELWSIENNTQSSALPEFMRQKGYDLVEFAGVDDLFRKRRPKSGDA